MILLAMAYIPPEKYLATVKEIEPESPPEEIRDLPWQTLLGWLASDLHLLQVNILISNRHPLAGTVARNPRI